MGAILTRYQRWFAPALLLAAFSAILILILAAGSVDIESPELTRRDRLVYAREQMLATLTVSADRRANHSVRNAAPLRAAGADLPDVQRPAGDHRQGQRSAENLASALAPGTVDPEHGAAHVFWLCW